MHAILSLVVYLILLATDGSYLERIPHLQAIERRMKCVLDMRTIQGIDTGQVSADSSSYGAHWQLHDLDLAPPPAQLLIGRALEDTVSRCTICARQHLTALILGMFSRLHRAYLKGDMLWKESRLRAYD
jgi:hypothetical protein